MTLDEAVREHRRALLAHCYRLLGSPDDAEDAVQETLLRAHRALQSWEGRASMRTWLYSIATNVCMDEYRSAARRPLPSDMGGPSSPAELAAEDPSILWLQPIADSLLYDERADPAAASAARSGVRLAFVAALQHLSPVQRSVLVLRDVLAFRAAEVADMLDLTVPAVNNHLQRARRRLADIAPDLDTTPAPDAEYAQANHYARAFIDADIDELIRLLATDVKLEMPPIPSWLQGLDHVVDFLGQRVTASAWRALSVGVNTQPAVALYAHTGDTWQIESVHVLAITGDNVVGVVVYRDSSTFTSLQLPLILRDSRHDLEVGR